MSAVRMFAGGRLWQNRGPATVKLLVRGTRSVMTCDASSNGIITTKCIHVYTHTNINTSVRTKMTIARLKVKKNYGEVF